MGKKQIKKNLKIFVQRARQKLIPEKIILFGSYAQGKATTYSDVDVLVISKTFAKVPEEKRLDILYDLTQDLYPDFHPYGFSPEEIKKVSPLSTLYEALKTGVVIA